MSTAMQSLQPLLEQIRRSWRMSPLPAFFGWWGGELRAMLPPRWQALCRSGADWHLLQRVDNDWVLRGAGQQEPLARWSDAADAPAQQAALNAALQSVDREDLRLALVLPPAEALRRTLALPLAARNNLPQVIAYEMDRQTPFSVAQVYYAVRELAQPPAGGRFQAELVAVRRDTLDPMLARLQTLGIGIDAADLALADDRLGVNLLPPDQSPHRQRPRRRLNLALAAGCVLLLALVLGQWLHNRRAALAQMQAQVQDMHGDVQQVTSLRQQLQDNAGAAGFLAQRKQKSVAMLSLLQDLTRRLPDSTWLERFSIDNTGQIGMQGQSKQAAKLLDVLKDSSLIDNPGFQGSIQPDATSGKERFYLVGQLHQPAASAAPPPTDTAPASGGSTP